MDQHAVRRRLPVRDGRSRRSRRKASSRTRRRAPASTTCARCSSTATPASRPRWRCASPGSAASTSSRSSTRTRSTSTARSRTRVTLPPEPARSAVLVVHAVRQPDPLDARHAAALPARRQPVVPDRRPRLRTPTVPSPSTSHPSSPPASPTATGSRRCRARDSSLCLRLYSPLQPFFDKSWRVGEVEPNDEEESATSRLDAIGLSPCSKRSSGVRVGASALLVGALIAYVTTPSPKLIAIVMALGAGLLIGSISFELIDEALKSSDVGARRSLHVDRRRRVHRRQLVARPEGRRRPQGRRRRPGSQAPRSPSSSARSSTASPSPSCSGSRCSKAA